jgi:hypothetical protein
MTEEPITKKEVTVLKCLRCGWEWQPKYKGRIPKTCANPACRSPNWQKPKGYIKPYTWKDPVHKTWIGRKDRKFQLV